MKNAGLAAFGLFIAVASASVGAAEAPAREAAIYYSFAPWDGAAYELRIPFAKTKDESDPCIRVFIWDNPEFEKRELIRFSGKEDPGGGPGKGRGRASYQSVLDKSWPEGLKGWIAFKSLRHGKPVEGMYEFTGEKGTTLKGTFKAAWGNEPPRGRIP